MQVISECNKAEDWYKDKKQQQDGLPKSSNPVLLAADIKKKTEFLDRYVHASREILCKPRFRASGVSCQTLLFYAIKRFVLQHIVRLSPILYSTSTRAR